MITKYTKSRSVIISQNFSSTDCDCNCDYPECVATFVDRDLIIALEELLILAGDFKIHSFYRCKRHNADVGGTPDSQHLLGKAADIQSLKGLNGKSFAEHVLDVDILEGGGLGIASDWVHTDIRGVKARWTYPIHIHN